MLWLSGLPWLIQCLATLFLLFQMIRLILEPNYGLPFQELRLKVGESAVLEAHRGVAIYAKHRVILDSGLFFLLELSLDTQRRIIVVFFDQLDPDEYRVLKILEKIS